MKRIIIVLGILVLVTGLVYARAPKGDYQFTGTILEADKDHFVVEKGKGEKWEFAIDKDTKINGTLKVGEKVTVKYFMTATNIEPKQEPAKKEKSSKKK